MNSDTPKNLLFAVVFLLLLAIAAIITDLLGLRQEITINQAITGQDYSSVATLESDYAKQVHGFQAHFEKDDEKAQSIYSELLGNKNPEIKQLALFNLADIYLQKAVQLELSDKPDTRIPLIELAKENYRSILRNNPQHWPSRYNLARALQILPDAEIRQQDDDDIMPERSPSAPVETIGYERLP